MQHLIIFTRYPEPGKTKTRLIPALGAEAAADLQRHMTEHTIAQVRLLKAMHSVSVTVWFARGEAERAGEDRSLLHHWLGSDLDYQSQGEGDLGARLTQAAQAALEKGATQVVIIGTDCPGVNAARLAQAFAALQTADVVLGPATDGGYYLIGLQLVLPAFRSSSIQGSRETRFNAMIPALFSNITWGTSIVLKQTVAIAHSLNLALAYLESLTDVDYPEDIAVWDAVQKRAQSPPERTPETLSVIIPVFNEAEKIAKTLLHLQQIPNVEAIVVDGGSTDDTVAIARSVGVLVLQTRPGRAHQMNVGAAIASGTVLLFLHADSQLPSGFAELVHQTLAQVGVIAGAFELKIDSSLLGLRLIEWGVKWRSRLLQLPYGDQALFLKADTFQKMGGFAELPIMEDFDLVRRLHRLGRVAIAPQFPEGVNAPASVITSARRWEKLGVVQTTLINQLVIIAYFLGVPGDRIAYWYRTGMKKEERREKKR